ncbi:sulfatase-like hydrolase/transferase [Yoonia sp. I 8.24]|uniref:sulfatase-like hydrolase/transferase n=1 Tax=Yoonia sp. I 8.24 TaxID=1537229 RepID=UPI001EE0EBA5|nr:sulfatase-like hydrolase/transferase [Yoonia sp. I 8.24]
MDFIREAGDTSWCLHQGYIKPHWLYIVPAPYHAMYPPKTHASVVRNEAERAKVIGGYIGLLKQIDDQLGELMAFLDAAGKTDDTMIIFTSDHGDYLGDHWMGEKELFHDASACILLIVVDPRPDADGTRGLKTGTLVEAIDLAPTILEYFGGAEVPHIIEGQPLSKITHGTQTSVREFAVSEYDYAFRQIRRRLGVEIADAKEALANDPDMIG